MRDDDPINREPRFSDPPLRRDEMMVERESGLTTLGILAALAVAIAAGAYFWNASDGQQQVASNNTPAVTIPKTPPAPPPTAPDSAKTDSR
jgi:hypothetical protein